MKNVVALKTVDKPVLPVDEELVNRLKDLVKRARRGEIQGVAYVTIASTGHGHWTGTGDGWAGQGAQQNMQTVIGGVHLLLGRMVDKMNQRDEDEDEDG